MTLDTWRLHGWTVVFPRSRFLMARKTDFRLWHRESYRRQIALRHRDVADRAWRTHRRMHRSAGNLLFMTGRANRVLVE